MNSLIRIWIGLMLLLMTALEAEGAEVSPITILCPCSFEPQNQTYGLAKFSVVFNDPVAASGAVNVEFAMFKDLDFSNWSLLSSAEINSLAYKAAPQAVEVRLPTYVYSEPATGFAGLRITNTTDFNFYDGVLLSTSDSTHQKVYGLSSVNSLPMMFLTPPEFSATVDSATLTVSKLYTPALANETDSFDVLVTVGKGAESFFIKGTTLATVSYDADGIAQLQVTIPLSDALDNHLNQDGSKTEVQIRIKRGETQILSYWVDSLAADGVAPSIGSVMTAPDTLKDTDGDGISDFNEGLLGSDPRIQDLVDQVNIELVYTYGKTAKDQYGDELDARLILLHEAAKAVFSASGVPVNLVELQRVDVGDESGLSAEDVIAQMEQRTGLFANFDAKLDRKPDLIIHFGLEEVLDTGGLANLQGGLADGIIASGSAYASGLNVGVVGVDGVDELTLPHEIGHLMGLVHSKAQGEADGAFPWSRGHGVNGDFVTTMGYSTAFEDAPALGYFSSPSLKCGGSGLPCGIARSDYASGADAVLTLQTTAYQIAAISNGYSPVLTIIGDNPATVTSEAAILELTATATDAEDGSLTTKIKATVAAAPAGSQGFTHVQTYSVEDADRNTQSAVRKINLVEQAADSDNDGVVDEQDAFPNDSSETADSDKDGVGDNADAFPNDATETLDTDGDGVGDNKDAFPNNPAESSDTDGDKVGDKADAFPTNSAETVDTDGDGTGNNADLDDDDDGFTDAEEVAAGTDPLSASSCPGCFSFDIDDDGEAKALTDGLLVIRHLFGFSGEALTAGAVGSGAKRSTPVDIASYLTNAAIELDIDGDDEAKALTDGLLLIRYLFGFTGNALAAGAVGEAAERATASAIQAYIAQRLPDSNGSASGSDDGGGLGSDTGDAGGSGTDGSDTGVDSGGGSTSGGSTDGGTSDGGTDSGGDSDDSGGTDGGSAGTKTIEIDVVYDRECPIAHRQVAARLAWITQRRFKNRSGLLKPLFWMPILSRSSWITSKPMQRAAYPSRWRLTKRLLCAFMRRVPAMALPVGAYGLSTIMGQIKKALIPFMSWNLGPLTRMR